MYKVRVPSHGVKYASGLLEFDASPVIVRKNNAKIQEDVSQLPGPVLINERLQCREAVSSEFKDGRFWLFIAEQQYHQPDTLPAFVTVRAQGTELAVFSDPVII